ncbi:MAG: GNAT family N-acetyltransferase [Gammaproteobacteria bacterium]|nr:GNAT family N-acetyltransferase [Gammaproteobacteria bacterium]MDE2249862.1 GNAT family N-acetyltransferase [Gammaproteobacteria bacterium]
MVTIRPAVPADTPLILRFIRALGEYERLSSEVVATEAALHATLFGARPYAEVALAYCDGECAGFALFFHNYSTFLARPGIYLEDLFVDPAYRTRGVGKALLQHLARLCVERGCGRLEWSALKWNRLAIDFYLGLGAVAMHEWCIYRLHGGPLQRLAATANPG